MNRDEVVDLLTLIAVFDNRQIGQVTADSWLLVLGDLNLADCQAAVQQHFRTSTDWLMPAHVRQLVKDLRAKRLEGVDVLLPAADPDRENEYRDGMRRIRRHLGEGNVIRLRQIPAAKAGPSKEFQATREEMEARRKDAALARARAELPPAEAQSCDAGHLLDPDGTCRICTALDESETA